MKTLPMTFSALLLAFGITVCGAQAAPLTEAEARTLVQPFYDLLGGKATPDQAREAFDPNWKSYYSNTGFKTLDQTLGAIGGFHKMIPDLSWTIKAVSVTDRNEIVVRGEATGTPVGEKFFGVPLSGKSFTIMSIDVHSVENGKIVRSHHIEDWARAMRQLGPAKK